MDDEQSRYHPRRRWRQAAARHKSRLVAAGVLLCGCVYDPHDRCDPGQVFNGDSCTCPANTLMLDGGACQPCGANEIVSAGACQCVAGYSRSSQDAGCEPNPADMGVACDPASAPCASPVYGHCEATSGTSGYCTTSGCTSADQCTGGYDCDTNSSPSYCRRPPTGYGATCGTDADCASYDAKYCETMVAHQCLVNNCTKSPNSCFVGYDCCDLTTLGIPQKICIPKGNCPT
jgi:hypothetical protein